MNTKEVIDCRLLEQAKTRVEQLIEEAVKPWIISSKALGFIMLDALPHLAARGG